MCMAPPGEISEEARPPNQTARPQTGSVETAWAGRQGTGPRHQLPVKPRRVAGLPEPQRPHLSKG